jgi:hypothetical protein
MPVKGLTFTEEEVLFNGLPIEQASHSQRMKIGVALALHGKENYRIVLIRDGSLLDKKSEKMLAQIADEMKAQIFVERVGTGKDNHIIIEDGEIVDMNNPEEG